MAKSVLRHVPTHCWGVLQPLDVRTRVGAADSVEDSVQFERGNAEDEGGQKRQIKFLI